MEIPVGRDSEMRISLAQSRANGFTKWFNAHRPGSNDDDQPGGATPVAIAAPDLNDPMVAPPEQPDRPRLVPGVGAAL
jgi:hypothetical protein